MSSPSPEPRMAQNSNPPASYGPLPTSPNTPTSPPAAPATPGDMSRPEPATAPPPRATSTYVPSPLNPNASFTGPIARSRPPSAGSSALQAEISQISRDNSSEGDARTNTLSQLYNANNLYAVSPESPALAPSAWHTRSSLAVRRSTPAYHSRFSPQPLRPPSTAVNHRFSTMSSAGSILSFASDSKYPAYAQNNLSNSVYVESFPYGGGESPDLYAPLDDGPEDDDALHEPDPKGYKEKIGLSTRGCFNVGMIVLVIGALLALFISYPIVHYVQTGAFPTGGNVNGTGQVAVLYAFYYSCSSPLLTVLYRPGLPNLVDKDTPQEARTRTGFDGEEYELVFSDEFNLPGRSFFPGKQLLFIPLSLPLLIATCLNTSGDDPFWEAVDLNYWATRDLEWYDPSMYQLPDNPCHSLTSISRQSNDPGRQLDSHPRTSREPWPEL